MTRDALNKSYEYSLLQGWLELPEDPVEEMGLMWQPEQFEELGYYPRPSIYGEALGGAYVEVYTQSADSDDAPYTFMCRVGLAGSQHNVYVENLPSLVGLLREMGPAMQTWDPSNPPSQ